jgi:hypothetical protein
LKKLSTQNELESTKTRSGGPIRSGRHPRKGEGPLLKGTAPPAVLAREISQDAAPAVLGFGARFVPRLRKRDGRLGLGSLKLAREAIVQPWWRVIRSVCGLLQRRA